MMSQNRQEAKDRMRAEYGGRVNLKGELEVRNLHEKLDHLLTNHWQRLLEPVPLASVKSATVP